MKIVVTEVRTATGMVLEIFVQYLGAMDFHKSIAKICNSRTRITKVFNTRNRRAPELGQTAVMDKLPHNMNVHINKIEGIQKKLRIEMTHKIFVHSHPNG